MRPKRWEVTLILDLEFRREGIPPLTEGNLILPIDHVERFELVSGRARLEVCLWRDQAGIVVVAGPYMDHAMIARWRGQRTTPNRWHSARLESNLTRHDWSCRYRIFEPKSTRQARSTRSR